jgi:hypothetical protein
MKETESPFSGIPRNHKSINQKASGIIDNPNLSAREKYSEIEKIVYGPGGYKINEGQDGGSVNPNEIKQLFNSLGANHAGKIATAVGLAAIVIISWNKYIVKQKENSKLTYYEFLKETIKDSKINKNSQKALEYFLDKWSSLNQKNKTDNSKHPPTLKKFLNDYISSVVRFGKKGSPQIKDSPKVKQDPPPSKSEKKGVLEIQEANIF